MRSNRVFRGCALASLMLTWCAPVWAQTPASSSEAQQDTAPPSPRRWHLMQDGVVYGLFNHQGGPRGGNEFVVPNWWMGMLTRERGRQQFGLNLMLSLDAATVGKSGYAEIFQVGEALDGEPLIDRQHPHDFLMQLSATWRRPLGQKTDLTFAAALAGEPALGPVAFMHRASAAGLPFAPLGHHTFDSTHISFGVVTAAVERGRWTLEGSAFNAREPDEDRWDLDLGALDSAAARLWFRPTAEWSLQVSSGRLRDPEELEPGDLTRTTASASWFRGQGGSFDSITGGYGVNDAHGVRRHGVFAELTRERHANAVFGRIEYQQLESSALLHDQGHGANGDDRRDAVVALTGGATRRLGLWRGAEGAMGAQVTLYGVPNVLQATHGDRPVSAQVFFRLRLPAGAMGRMWNTTMSRPPRRGAGHAGHTMQ